jgi:hypothetical protein
MIGVGELCVEDKEIGTIVLIIDVTYHLVNMHFRLPYIPSS